MIDYTLETVPCPLKLTCTVSGKVTMYTAREYILGKIKQAGSLEALLSTYVCKAARGGAKAVVAKAAKAPAKAVGALARSWKGEQIIKDPSGAPKDPKDEKPVEMMHLTFKVDGLDGDAECNVYAPKASPENLSRQTFDFRKRKADTTCVSNGN